MTAATTAAEGKIMAALSDLQERPLQLKNELTIQYAYIQKHAIQDLVHPVIFAQCEQGKGKSKGA